MIVFFQCVAEAVAEKGLRGLAELVPGGGPMFDIAKSTWEKYRQRRQIAQMGADIQSVVLAKMDDIQKAAAEAAKQAAGSEPELVPILEVFLTQIPAAMRQSLKRADDPTGTTVPATFALRGPEDVAKLLPAALPRFKPGDPLPGRPGWRLERQLGIGGFGEVWLTRHPKLQSLLGAVKFCRNLDTRDRDLLHESNVIDRLLQQGEHPNIVKLIDADLDGDTAWLMYEYVEGGDLTDLIHEWSALPPAERQQKAIAALKELAETIAHFHRLDPAIVHRDLKPANILRDKKGRLRITDFGISGIAAKHMIEDETRGVTTRAGRLQSYLYGSYTPLYASPQQKDGAAPDPRDDVHALGVIGYQMLTCRVSQGVGSDFADDLKEGGVEKELIELLGQCTAARLERRPMNAVAIAARIKQIEKERGYEAAVEVVETKGKVREPTLPKKEGNSARKATSPQSGDEEARDRQTATREGTLAAYRRYLRTHSKSENADAVRRLADQAQWSEAAKGNNSESYREYLAEFPKGRHAEEAHAWLSNWDENHSWATCRQIGKAKSYREYLATYPQGRYAETAREMGAWLKAQENDTCEAFERYLADHPEGKHRDDAMERASGLLRDLLSEDLWNKELRKRYLKVRTDKWRMIDAGSVGFLQRGFGLLIIGPLIVATIVSVAAAVVGAIIGAIIGSVFGNFVAGAVIGGVVLCGLGFLLIGFLTLASWRDAIRGEVPTANAAAIGPIPGFWSCSRSDNLTAAINELLGEKAARCSQCKKVFRRDPENADKELPCPHCGLLGRLML